MAQMEVFLGSKMDVHFPSVATGYTELLVPDDVSDTEDNESEMLLLPSTCAALEDVSAPATDPFSMPPTALSPTTVEQSLI